ncbi:WhiB family transcriptional regulator [Streptomyces venezuelae]|uniref:Transcriptional regulator n=1 Tax=Streptomyces venezuelae TaxID=54571 RepID=A0A5P2B5N1_STRVZ|nr:WhiB family transcriptional regulator [Streptomyces venezuelae]QES25882.1 transcriptional regulator [Streptomyces venezuelae]
MSFDWMADALCAQVGPDLFFPNSAAGYRQAKQICDRCPVREDCTEAAAAYEGTSHRHLRHGTWGGLTPTTRTRQNREAS